MGERRFCDWIDKERLQWRGTILIWVGPLSNRPTDMAALRKQKLWVCRGCVANTVDDAVRRSKNPWNRETGRRTAIGTDGSWWRQTEEGLNIVQPGDTWTNEEVPRGSPPPAVPGHKWGAIPEAAEEGEVIEPTTNNWEHDEATEWLNNLEGTQEMLASANECDRRDRTEELLAEGARVEMQLRQQLEQLQVDREVNNLPCEVVRVRTPDQYIPCNSETLEVYQKCHDGVWSPSDLEQWRIQRIQERADQCQWDDDNARLEADMEALAKREGWVVIKRWMARR